MSVLKVQQELEAVAAPYVKALHLRVVEHDGDKVTVILPVTPEIVHGGGVVCGQALMAAADTAMVIALSAVLGGFRPMTTAQLNTSFLRPVPKETTAVRIVCTVLRRGRSLAFGEIEMFLPDGKLAAHASTTYAFL